MLLSLAAEDPTNPVILYQCAWTHDSMGLEREAVSFYERAIENGLTGDELSGAYLGLGSTLRGLGEYERALEILTRGAESFPDHKAIQVFLAMALYNEGRSKDAVSGLLRLLVEISNDQSIADLKCPILTYAEDLDKIWDK